MTGLLVVDSFSSSGSVDRPNEDAFGACARAAWMIDGATGQGEGSYIAGPGQSDAAWLAQRANETFSDLSQDLSPEGPGEFFAQVRERVLADFNRLSRRVPEADYAWPSAALARVFVQGDFLCCESLGDCTVLVRFRDGAVGVHGGDPIQIQMDKKAIDALLAMRQRGEIAPDAEPLAARSILLPLIRENRNRANEDGGYGSFTLSKPIRPDFVRRTQWRLSDVSFVLMATDGLYAAVEDYGLMTDAALFTKVLSEGLEAVVGDLRAAEEGDPYSVRWPRLKKSDDATAILLRL